MSKRFCRVQLSSDWSDVGGRAFEHIPDAIDRFNNVKACYWADSRWSALCALLKEEIMEMLRDGKDDTYIEKARYVVALHGRNKLKRQVFSKPKPNFNGRCYLPDFS